MSTITRFCKTAIELANLVVVKRKILRLGTKKVLKFAEDIKELVKQDELEKLVVLIFYRLRFNSPPSDEELEECVSLLKDKEEISKYKLIQEN